MARLTAGELGILRHYAAHPKGVRLRGRLHPLTQQAAHELAPHVIPAPAPTISPYGVVTGTPLADALGTAGQVQMDPRQVLAGVVAHPGTPIPPQIRQALAGVGLLGQAEHLRVSGLHEDLGEPSDLTNAIVAAATLGLGSGAIGAIRGGQAAAEGLGAASAAEDTTTASKVLDAASRAVTAPIRHPVVTASSPVAAQVPSAVAQGNPNLLLNGFTGTGVAASALGGAGHGIRGLVPGLAGNALADLTEFPAQVLPSVYLTGKAGVDAALGNTQPAQELWKSFGEQSAFGRLLHGEFGQALGQAYEHPIYTYLEGEGLRGAAGAALGKILSRTGRFAPGRQQPPIDIYGGIRQEQGRYSNDALRRLAQERTNARRGAGSQEGTVSAKNDVEIRKYLNSFTDRRAYESEVTRKGKQAETIHHAESHRPSRAGRHRGQFATSAGKADDLITALQASGVVHHDPARAVVDLAAYKDQLDAAAPNLPPDEYRINRANARDIEKAISGATLDNRGTLEQTAARDRGVEAELVAQGHLTSEQAAKDRAIGYAVTHMGSTYGLSNADRLALENAGADIGLRSKIQGREQHLDANGDPLGTAAIVAHAVEHGYDPSLWSYVSHELKQDLRPGGYFTPPKSRPSRYNQVNTGAGVRNGTFDFSYDAIVNAAIKNRTLADTTGNFDNFIDHVGLGQPNGHDFPNSAAARHFAEHPEDYGAELPHVPGGYIAVRKAPFLANKDVLEAVEGLGQNRAREGDPTATIGNEHNGVMLDAIERATLPTRDPYKDGPVVLVPKQIWDRWQQHFQPSGDVAKLAQATVTAFKGAKLPTSPTWLGGNAADNLIVRPLFTGLNLLEASSGKAFRDLMAQEIGPDHADRAIESIITGGVYSSVKKIQPYRDARQFETSNLYPLVKAFHDLRVAPGVKQLGDLYTRYRDAVFHFDGKFIEQWPQYAQLSKSVRQELGLTRRQWRKAIAAQEPVVLDMARGFRDPNKVDYTAKLIERVFGNWGKNSPLARRTLNTYSPFWQWARAATKFVFVTVPRDHPVVAAMVAAAEQMTREEREKLGFDLFLPNRLPDYLQGGIPDPLHPGGVSRVANLTSFGEFTDLPEVIGSSLTPPPLSGLITAGLGVNWSGDKLVNANGEPMNVEERLRAAMITTGEAFLPFLDAARRVGKHGVTEGLNPVHSYDAGSVASQREPRKELSVPVQPSSGENQYKGSFGGGGASENPYSGQFGSGGAEENPYAGSFGGG